MKHLVGCILAITIVTLLIPSKVMAIDASEPPIRLPASPLIMTAYYIAGEAPGYIELYNTGNDVINIRDYAVTLKWSTGQIAPFVAALSIDDSYLPSHQYIVVSFGSTVFGASIKVDAISGATGSFINEISVGSAVVKPYTKTFLAAQTQRMMLNETSTGYTSTGSYSVDTRTSVYDNGLYVPSSKDFPLAPVEILANPRTCAPTEMDTACREYVKFYNSTNEVIDFNDTRLRIGYQGQAATATNTIQLGGVIKPGEYAVFDRTESGAPLTIANTGGYVWLEDKYSITVFPSTVISYADASSDTHKGQSWALVDGAWQWAAPNPAGPSMQLPIAPDSTNNTVATLAPCRADQYRNPDTNRCKAIEVSAAAEPCDTGEYRNLETGRCKKVGAAASGGAGLQPCEEGQYRNPETNRCKSIATQTSGLAPCQEGWERNPETNRCRKISNSTMPKADFAIEPYKAQKQSGLGWIAFAVVGATLAGYGIWEWRQEIANTRRKLAMRFVR